MYCTCTPYVNGNMQGTNRRNRHVVCLYSLAHQPGKTDCLTNKSVQGSVIWSDTTIELSALKEMAELVKVIDQLRRSVAWALTFHNRSSHESPVKILRPHPPYNYTKFLISTIRYKTNAVVGMHATLSSNFP
jgi:hypothetical protein